MSGDSTREHIKGGDFHLKVTLGKKIGGLVGVILLLFIISAAYTQIKLSHIGKEMKELAHLDLPMLNFIDVIEELQLRMIIDIEKLKRLAPAVSKAPSDNENTKKSKAIDLEEMALVKNDLESNQLKLFKILKEARETITNKNNYTSDQTILQYKKIQGNLDDLNEKHQKLQRQQLG